MADEWEYVMYGKVRRAARMSGFIESLLRRAELTASL